jgi:hypothetical protein
MKGREPYSRGLSSCIVPRCDGACNSVGGDTVYGKKGCNVAKVRAGAGGKGGRPSPLPRGSALRLHMARSIVSYDDLIPAQSSSIGPSAQSSGYPPAKRQKRNQHFSNGSRRPAQHWDDPSASMHSESFSPASTSAPMSAPVIKAQDLQEGAEVELSHDEIWDDSALVDAWDAAQEEYRVRASVFRA